MTDYCLIRLEFLKNNQSMEKFMKKLTKVREILKKLKNNLKNT